MVDLEARRRSVAAMWALSDEVVLVGAGAPVPIPGTDQFFEFRAHPEYRYLADTGRPGDMLAFDPRSGWTHFAPRLSEDDLVWHGGEAATGMPLSELDGWLAARAGRAIAELGCPAGTTRGDQALRRRLRATLDAARRIKDEGEQARMRAAAQATRSGFSVAMKEARPTMTERQLQVEIEAAFLRAGARRPAYDSIVAGGENGAVLHFTPSARPLEAGELLLVDAGAEVDGYACDCTRTWVVGGRPSAEQADLHGLLREAQEAAVEQCVPGREFREIHMATCVRIAQGLIDFGLLRGSAESLVERDVHALFYPHGLGHLLGLAIHDPGGYADGRTPSERPGLRWLRADLPLAPGITITVEPGIYFIRALLENEATRDRFRDAVDWLRVDALMGLGGIRIEDTVLVTEGGPDVLTRSIPRSIVV